MKKILITAAVSVSTIAFAAAADNSYVSRALVVDSTPVIDTVYEEVEVCRYEIRKPKGKSSAASGDRLIGGILGGAAGSAFGKGSGRDAAAAVGAVLGSEVTEGDGELTGGELIGGIAGGLIGNQIGGGSGKTAATAAGALIGSMVGDNIENGNNAAAAGPGRKVRVCDIREEPKKVIVGYTVTFEHDGLQFTDFVKKRPTSDYLDIHVNVEVVEDYTSSR